MQLVILLSSSICPIWSKLRRGIQLSPGGPRFHLGPPAKAEPGPKQNCSPPEFHVKRPHLTKNLSSQKENDPLPSTKNFNLFQGYSLKYHTLIPSTCIASKRSTKSAPKLWRLSLRISTAWNSKAFIPTLIWNLRQFGWTLDTQKRKLYLPKSHGNFCASSTFMCVTDLNLMTVGKDDAVAHWIHTQHFHKLQML